MMRQLLPPLTDRDEWLTWRRGGIGASDVAGILGLSQWDTPTTVWLDKLGRLDDADDTDAMMHGRYAEAVLAPWYADTHDCAVAAEQWRAVGVEEWQRATLDGLTFASERSRVRLETAEAVLECKATGQAPAAWEADGIPIQYRCQATWQSITTGIPTVVFAVVHVPWGRLQFRAYAYTPSDRDIDFVTTKVAEFWHDRVLAGVAPPADGDPATTTALQHAWDSADVVDDLIDCTDQLADLCARVDELGAIARAAKAEHDQARNQLRAHIGEHAGVAPSPDGWGATWRPSRELDQAAVFADHPDIANQYRKAELDLDRFRADHPELAEKYTAATGSRRLNITRPKKEKSTL